MLKLQELRAAEAAADRAIECARAFASDAPTIDALMNAKRILAEVRKAGFTLCRQPDNSRQDLQERHNAQMRLMAMFTVEVAS